MQDIKKAISVAVEELFNTSIEPELSRTDEQFGDFASNVAMQLGKQLGINPREVAQQIAEHVQGTTLYVESVTVAGPGFINFTLSDKALWDLSLESAPQTLTNKNVVVEYSDPNPFKVMHAGHLYTTIVGDAIAKLLENAGAKVHRLNYGGDVGLHVAKAMWGIINNLGGEIPEKLNEIDPAKRSEWMSNRYVGGNSAYETNEISKTEIIAINKKVYQLHADNVHDSSFAQIYWTCRQWSYEGFDDLYAQLGIDPFEKYIPESEVTPIGIDVSKEALKKGVLVKSEGAIVYRGEDKGLHTRVFINSAGLPTYEAKDLGLAVTKWREYQFDLSIIITANDIVEYMKVVLSVIQNFYPEAAERTKHLTHGLIKLPGGVKMSSRKGNILLATDIIESANEANKKQNEQDNPDSVLAAIKYAFLRQRIGGDIVYDPSESVAIEGNSGPYLQYAHARARSILRKAGVTNQELRIKNYDLEQGERSLVRKIGEYAETVERATGELMPHHICTYLFELAQVFNNFYEHNRVIGDKRQDFRLELVKSYADTLKNGLSLLNIVAPDKM